MAAEKHSLCPHIPESNECLAAAWPPDGDLCTDCDVMAELIAGEEVQE